MKYSRKVQRLGLKCCEVDRRQWEKIENWSMVSRAQATRSPNLPNFKTGLALGQEETAWNSVIGSAEQLTTEIGKDNLV